MSHNFFWWTNIDLNFVGCEVFIVFIIIFLWLLYVCTYLSNSIIKAILIFKNHCGFNTKTTLNPCRHWFLWATSLQTLIEVMIQNHHFQSQIKTLVVATRQCNVCQVTGMWRKLQRTSWKHKLDLLSLCLLVFKLLSVSNELTSRRMPGRCSVNKGDICVVQKIMPSFVVYK